MSYMAVGIPVPSMPEVELEGHLSVVTCEFLTITVLDLQYVKYQSPYHCALGVAVSIL